MLEQRGYPDIKYMYSVASHQVGEGGRGFYARVIGNASGHFMLSIQWWTSHPSKLGEGREGVVMHPETRADKGTGSIQS